MSRLLPILLALLTLAACDTAETNCDRAADADCLAPRVVAYVGNQGVFSDNSGTITAYDVAAGEAETLVASGALGGLVQRVFAGSFVTSGPELFVLLNYDDSFATGSGRIEQRDPEDGALVWGLDVGTPRDLAAVGGGRAFVSNLYGGTVTPVDLVEGTAGTPVPVGENPEGVAASGGRVYVANSGFGFGTTVSVIDAGTNAVVETLEDVCVGPRTLLVDAEAEVWVLCTGFSDFETGEVVEDGAVVVLDGATGAEVARIGVEGVLGAAGLGQDAAYSAVREELFAVLGQEILRFDTAANALAGRFAVEGPPVSAVGYHEATERLYLGRLDASNPYSAAGFVSIHDESGAEVGRFGAGVVPGALAFQVLGAEG